MKKYIPYFLLLLFAGVIVSKAILGLDSGHQHDFISYYYGAKSIIMGLNGYDSHVVSTMSGQGHQSHLRFVYPPQMAWVFAPLTAFSFLHARLIFLCIKLITATGLIALYLKFFVKENHLLSFLLISLFAFRGPFTSDILAGNIATFETLLLWLGFLFLVMGRSYLFALFIALAGSFKLLPLAFLGFIFLSKTPQKWRFLGAGVGVAILIQCTGILGMSQMYQTFLSTPAPLDSSGYVNPSILAWLQFELIPWLTTYGVTVSAFGLYVLFVFLFLAGLAVFFWKNRHEYPLVIQISMGILAYGLLSPRLKDYSFLIFVIPAYYAVLSLPKRWQQGLVLALFCVSLWPYHHWTMLLLALGILMTYGHTLESSSPSAPYRQLSRRL